MADGDVEGGVALPRDEDDRVLTATVGRELVGGLAFYLELFAQLSTERNRPSWLGTFDAGLTYAVTDDVQLDAGVNVGLTRAAMT